MKSLPKRALIATTLATALVGTFATALVQASALHPSALAAGTADTVVAQADTAAKPAVKPAAPTAEQRDQKRAERHAQMQKRMAERQAAFKAELKLTPEQEPAWSAFIARTQPQVGAMPRQGTREDWSKLTTPQRLDKMQALKAERDAAMAKRVDAIKSFYAVLNADQQKVFDSKHLGGFQRAGMHRGHRGEHRHHGEQPGVKKPT
ncbi:MAG: Spy/CpxP family protein refolding chaperone [Hydrogenophaga sp.]|uniref:Spy/CpxP family protein refolding chaperone n=1 Tax=Hydrogenophaga sp. TaxID=1904254 RepID=UPI0040354324